MTPRTSNKEPLRQVPIFMPKTTIHHHRKEVHIPMDKPEHPTINEQLRQQTEQNLVTGFNRLTDAGREKVLDYMIDLLSIDKYRLDAQAVPPETVGSKPPAGVTMLTNRM